MTVTEPIHASSALEASALKTTPLRQGCTAVCAERPMNFAEHIDAFAALEAGIPVITAGGRLGCAAVWAERRLASARGRAT